MMNLSESQIKSVKRVVDIFADYIKSSSYLDVIWSDKVGYILITGISKDGEDISMSPEVLHDGETLCDQLVFEIACDAIEASGQGTHNPWESTSEEKERIRSLLKPYLDQLPEYQYMVEKLFVRPE